MFAWKIREVLHTKEMKTKGKNVRFEFTNKNMA